MDGTGTAIIFDVVYHAPTLQTTTSSNEAVMTSWRALESLQKERDIAREQSEFVASYGRSMNSQTMSIEGLELFVEMFGPRQVAVAKRIQELEIQVEKAENEYNQLRTSVYEDVQGEKRAAKVTVTVLAETDGNAELVLTYGMFNIIKHILGWSLDDNVAQSLRTQSGRHSTTYALQSPSLQGQPPRSLYTTEHRLLRRPVRTGQMWRSHSRLHPPNWEVRSPRLKPGELDPLPRSHRRHL